MPAIMPLKTYRFLLIYSCLAMSLSACAPGRTVPADAAPAIATATTTPDWFDIELTDVQTGKTFTMNDYSGKVVLLETIAIWCPSCIIQATQVEKLHEALGNPDDLISVSLDVDSHEDEATLKEYASSYHFDWHFAVAPLLVERALGNLYSAEYLNPPLSPMLVIDREGNVHQLDYGIKDVETLTKIVEPYLSK
jgi:cytochrome oxidase Cu insertion factor (SCO1/SenC/PrrC family)